MSKYDWERGEFKLSVVMYRQFRDALVKAWNERQEHNHKVAVAFHIQLAIAIKTAKRGADILRIGGDLLVKTESKYRGMFYGHVNEPVFKFEDLDVYVTDFLVRTEKGFKLGPVPKKKDYPLANSATTSFHLDDCTVSLDAKTRTLTWDVSENNHAVERARGTKLWQTLIGLLKNAAWTRGTGGVISGNDEYNRESRDSGDGANYLKEVFGPVGKAEREAEYGYHLVRPRRTAKRKL